MKEYLIIFGIVYLLILSLLVVITMQEVYYGTIY